MRNIITLLLLTVILPGVFSGCKQDSPSPTSHQVQPPSSVPPTDTLAVMILTPTPQGETIIVTSVADSGTNTLRQAMMDAKPGDLITFDPVIFPPDAPVTIFVNTVLPGISQGHIIIDATQAGVILDGSNLPDGFNAGISFHSHSNTVRGMQVVGFAGAGIAIDYGQNNRIENNVSCGNDFGIGIWGIEAANNTIVGNYLGVLADGVTQLGNRTAGITIMEGANGNFIGPGNHIAYNGHTGIEIYFSNTTGNLISQNSIHDNGERGIYLWDGGNHEITAPVIFDFDLNAGTVAGTACAGCIVEIFSDNSDEGAIFEGQASADSNGVFAFEKGMAFAGPYLTSTAHDDYGDTSKFSTPTFGTGRKLIFQEGNNLPRAWLETKRSDELEDNRIGSVGMTDALDPLGNLHDLDAILDEVLSMGLQQFRFTIVNIDGTLVDWTMPEFTFTQRQRDFITAMDENGINVTYLLQFRDDVLGGEGRTLQPRFKTEEEIQRYLDYVRFIISNIKGHVTYYEIFNEPNIANSVQWIEVEDYINLVRRVVPVIRQEDPNGKIMLAGTTELIGSESHDYLFSILNSNILPLVDVISWHPFYGASPEFNSEYYYNYPSLVQQIKDTAVTHGFTGEYHAGEISWWTKPETETQDMEGWYSEIAAGKYHARGTVMNLGMDVSVTHSNFSTHEPSRSYVVTVITNLCTVMAGAQAAYLPVEIESEATNIESYTFSLPNNEYLVALWTDGVAVDDDPGISATLTMPNFSAGEVVGIDVLYGFEQPIIANTEDGNLVVRDLLVKDYPIILRFMIASSP